MKNILVLLTFFLVLGCSESEKKTSRTLTHKQIAQAEEDIKFSLLNNNNINYVQWVYNEIYVGIIDKSQLNDDLINLVCDSLRSHKLNRSIIFVEGNNASLIEGFMLDKFLETDCQR